MITTRFKALTNSLGNVLVIGLALLLAAPLHAAWQSAVNGRMLGKRMPPLALPAAAAPAAPRSGAGMESGTGSGTRSDTDPASVAGGVVLLDFWAPWCAPCQERVPLLNALQAAYRAQGLTVIGMAREAPGQGAGVRQRVPFAYAVGADPTGGLFAQMGVRSLPYAVLVDRNGIVVWQGDPSRLSRATIETTLQAPRLGTLTRF